MTWRELVYMITDITKQISDDSNFNEDHIIFLCSKYRNYILNQQYLTNKKTINEANYQTIEIPLTVVSNDICIDTNNILRSVDKIPHTMTIGKKEIFPTDIVYNRSKIVFVNESRFPYIGNKYTNNIIYATIAADNYLYLKSQSPNYIYLKSVTIKALFEDIKEVALLDSNTCGCDINVMDNQSFEELWFQKLVYKKQNYGKLLFIQAVEEDDIPKVIAIRAEDWDGEDIQDIYDSTFIEAIDFSGNIVFIYNIPNKTLCVNNTVYPNCSVDKISSVLGDTAHEFFKGKKLKDYIYKTERLTFIKNKLFTFQGGLYYILKQTKKSIQIGGSHNDSPIYTSLDVYLVYDGKNICEITYDNNSLGTDYYNNCEKIHSCIISDIDEECKQFNVKLALHKNKNENY